MGREELKWRQLAHHQLVSQQGPRFSPTVKLKPIIKAQILGKLVTSVITDVAIASLHSEKTRLKKISMIIIIITMNKSQESTLLAGSTIDFHYKTDARKVMVDFKFDALYSKSS